MTFTPTHQLKPQPVETMQVSYDNLEEVADFIGAVTIALTNPSGNGMIVIYQLDDRKLEGKMGFWFLKNADGQIATLSPMQFESIYEPYPKEITK